jgi:hypothetical protein
MGKVDEVYKQVLSFLLIDFQSRELDAAALSRGYVGMNLPELREKCIERDNTTTNVDFDLAIKDLERDKLISTGPQVAYENEPNSMVFVMGVYSKREYAYLTPQGYKAAR